MIAARPTLPHIVFIGLNYAPEPVGIGPFTAGMAEGLAQSGHTVQAIVGQPYYPQWRAYPGFGGWARSTERGVSLIRCPHYIPAKPSGWRRIVHLASFSSSALVPALRAALAPKARRPHVFICIAPALMSVPVAWIAARIAGARLWIHVQDFEVEAAFATGLIEAGPFARIAAQVERRLLALADRISSISPQMCARLVAKGVPQARVIEVRNWANAPDPDPNQGAAYRREWGLGNRKVALYSGNVANKQGIEIIVEAARLLANRPDIALIICGEGPNRARLEALAAGLPNVQFHDLQPAARMGELLSLASVHLLPQIAGAADLVLPSKLANMLASARPVIATAEPGTGLYAEVAGCGVATAPGDAGALARAIAELIDNPARSASFGQEGAVRAAERWSQSGIVAQMSAEIARLLCDD
jgi:colanic acid biosynthesis glycosyl transferase WcaI